MVYTTDIQVRFHDTDANGHLNNATYAVYSEYNRVRFLEEIPSLKGKLILANLNIDFLKETKFNDTVSVNLQILKLGNSSISLYQEVITNGEIAAKINSVVVVFDYSSKSSIPIPGDAKEKLKPYMPE